MKQEELRYTGTQAYGQQDVSFSVRIKLIRILSHVQAGSSNNGTPYTGGDASATFLAGQMSVMEEGSYMDVSTLSFESGHHASYNSLALGAQRYPNIQEGNGTQRGASSCKSGVDGYEGASGNAEGSAYSARAATRVRR